MKFKGNNWFKKGFRAYYLLVVSIIVITIAIQSIIQYSLNKQRSTALVVNLAGQQRMISQQILNELYSCRFHNCDYAELKLSLNKLLQMNHTLQHGNESLSIDPVDDEEILANFAKLEPHLNWLKENLNDFDKIQHASFDEVREQTDEFSFIMGEIVFQFQKQSEEHISGMMIIEAELAIFSLFILLFEIFFIVNPIIKRIIDQKKKLGEIAWHQSHAFESHLKNIKDMQYVLAIEKNPERQQEIVKFITEEMDSLDEVSKNMQNALKNSEKDEMPHSVFLKKMENLLAKYNLISPDNVSHDDTVRSVKSKTPYKTVPQRSTVPSGAKKSSSTSLLFDLLFGR